MKIIPLVIVAKGMIFAVGPLSPQEYLPVFYVESISGIC